MELHKAGYYADKALELTLEYGPKVILAIVTLVIGFWIVGRITKILKKVMQKGGLDESLSKFLGSLAGMLLKVMVVLSVAGMFGVNTTSFIAILSALMVGVGMALNGTIGHFASGVMIMIFRPFKVNDLVEIGDSRMGTVEAINAFNTTLKTLDNKRIIVGNADITSNTITNISGQGIVGVELTFGIAYGASIDKAREVILKVAESCPYILKEEPKGVVVAELADSSVNLATRPFCKSEDYWDTRFFMQENVKKEFDNAGVEMPFPQMDVHMQSS